MYIQINKPYILTKYVAIKGFMTRSFLFNIINKSFHDRVIYIVQ